MRSIKRLRRTETRGLPGLALALIIALTAPAASRGATADTGPFAAGALGGLQGDRYVAHRNGDRYEYSEYVTIDFTHKVDMASFRTHFTIDPPAVFGVYGIDYGHRVRLNIRKVPGVTYTLTIAPGLASRDGATLESAASYQITTAPDPDIPAPLRATNGDAYRYGTLGHPFRASLDGPNADRIIDLLANAGIRFVRIDYCGSQILGDDTPKAQPNFKIEDGILDKLAARGITELPIIDQYCAPKWAANGKPYPAIFADPNVFARFAGLVAGHLHERYPGVTRMELFNEPNLHGWWRYPGDDPTLSKRSGSGAARYMAPAYAAIKAAAPGMTVVGPALSDGGIDTDPRDFLEELYANGCGRGKCWDVLSVHNYSWMNPDFPLDEKTPDRFDVYKDLQRIAAAHGDPGTHVMLTEWGYSHAEKINGFDPKVQAQYIALGFNRMLADPTVDGVVYVNVYNGGAPNTFWTETQVVSDDFTVLPGYDVIAKFAKR
jgi:hypothetical protein